MNNQCNAAPLHECTGHCSLHTHAVSPHCLLSYHLRFTLSLTHSPARSGAKKPPTPIDFNPADPLHAEFIYSAACLRATMYGVPTASCSEPQAAAAIAANVTVEKFR